MTTEQFAYWLKGFMEINRPTSIDAMQTQIIKDHLDLVFDKVTPDRSNEINKIDLSDVKKPRQKQSDNTNQNKSPDNTVIQDKKPCQNIPSEGDPENIKTENNTNNTQQKQTDYKKLIEKIDQNIDSLNKQLKALSGEYKVNTWKRMNEAANRQKKRDSFEIDIKILEYIKSKIIDNNSITELEQGLIIKAFRDSIHQYYIVKYGKYPKELKYPEIMSEYDNNHWYNKEVPTKQNRLKKAGIHNTHELNNAVEEYKVIYEACREFETPKQQQIRELTMKYKMQQKGDIQFTTNNNLLDQLIELADIQSNDKILEPSAGIGCITDRIKQITDNNNIDVCEYNYSFSELLQLKDYNIVANDFLTYNITNHYDKVIANVPFSSEQEHIKHIYKVLKPGGRAVIITSPHYTFANDSINFRNWLDNITHEIYNTPEKSFEHTTVNCKILVLYKDEEILQNAI